MATDFTYNGKTITTSGGIKPSGKNTPADIRTRVNLKADISSIPAPFIGMHIVVLQDETNSNKMTEYVVKSLKANSLGIADTVINEVVTLKEFLEVQEADGTGTSENQIIKTTKSEYSAMDEAEKNNKIFLITDEPLEEYSLSFSNNTLSLLKGENIISSVTINVSGGTTTTYGNIVLSKASVTIVEGETDTFTVKLDQAPTNNQTVSISANNTYITVNPSTLTFTSSNYSTPQTVTITVAEDNTDYSSETCIISCTSPNVTTKTLAINITDNDTPSTTTPTLLHSYDFSIPTGGGYDDLTGSYNLNSDKKADRNNNLKIGRYESFGLKLTAIYNSQYEHPVIHTGQLGGINVTSIFSPLEGRFSLTRGISYGSGIGEITMTYYDNTNTVKTVKTGKGIAKGNTGTIIVNYDKSTETGTLYVDGQLATTINGKLNIDGINLDNGCGEAKLELYNAPISVV